MDISDEGGLAFERSSRRYQNRILLVFIFLFVNNPNLSNQQLMLLLSLEPVDLLISRRCLWM